MQQAFAGRGLRVVAVNTTPWTRLEEWVAYWKAAGAGDVISAADTDLGLVRALGVKTLGTTIVIDRQGRIAYRDGRAPPYEALKAEIEKAF